MEEKISKDDVKAVDILFRAEIEFKGRSIEEFEKIVAALQELPVVIRVREWPRGHSTAGCWPVPTKDLRIRELEKLIKGKPRIRIDPIPGGLRVPHFHIDDKVVFVNHEEFKVVVGQIAKDLAEKLALKAEYTETVGAIRNLAPDAR